MKYIMVADTRPNFMKVAPIMEAFRARDQEQVLLFHTGQHYDEHMSDNFCAPPNSEAELEPRGRFRFSCPTNCTSNDCI
jgi:UDP-N-acetylglucosamine 2-epimerase